MRPAASTIDLILALVRQERADGGQTADLELACEDSLDSQKGKASHSSIGMGAAAKQSTPK